MLFEGYARDEANLPRVGREREAWGFPQLTLKFPPWSVCVYSRKN